MLPTLIDMLITFVTTKTNSRMYCCYLFILDVEKVGKSDFKNTHLERSPSPISLSRSMC